jgi:hypothetical protein
LRNRANFLRLMCVCVCFFYSECIYIGLRGFNQCGAYKTGFVGTKWQNDQNRDLKLKLWEEVAAECDSSCKQKGYFFISVTIQSCHVLRE